ncbi:MAG: alpha/beta hydrolase [Nitrososphaerales archaeon]
MPVAEANGVKLYYEQLGDRGDPLLLIHGSWTDHSNWNPVVAGLSETFRVVVYDRRGHGLSEKPVTQGSGEEDARDAAALLARLEMSPAHIVGNSSGGSIALKLAAAQPQLFRSLTAHEPPLFKLLNDDPLVQSALAEGNRRRDQVIRVLEGGDMVGAARLFVETLTSGPGAWDRMSPQARERMAANADTWLDETRDPEGSNVNLDALSRFDRPARLTYGGKGMRGSKLVVESIAKAIPNSRVEFDPEAGHSPHVTNPREFVRRVTAFALSSP